MYLLLENSNTPASYTDIFEVETLWPTDDDVLDSDFNYDSFFHDKLSGILEGKTYSLIAIPYSLSTGNPFSYIGMKLALHIRLTKEWGHIHTPILFVGPDSLDTLVKLSPYADLLGTSGIFRTSQTDTEKLKRQIQLILSNKPQINDFEYQNFLSKINIRPTDFYDNRHSIANEWGLVALEQITGHHIDALKDSGIQKDLYVKSLQLKYNISSPLRTQEPFVIPNTENRKILLIDDEWHKGWLEFYQKIFQDGKDGCQVDYLGIKKGVNQTKEYIEELLKGKLDEQDWDLFIVDIRLTDADHNPETQIHEYSGFYLINECLLELSDETDAMNSIIASTASQVHKVHDYAKALGVMASFIKPGVEHRPSEVNIDDLKCQIQDAFALSDYRRSLRDIVNNLTPATGTMDKLDCLKILQYYKSIAPYISQAFDCLKRKEWDWVFFNLFAIIEGFADICVKDNKVIYPCIEPRPIIQDKTWQMTYVHNKFYSYFINRSNKQSTYKDVNALAKASALLLFGYKQNNCTLKDFGRLNQIRNDIAHGERKEAKEDDVRSLIKILKILKVD